MIYGCKIGDFRSGSERKTAPIFELGASERERGGQSCGNREI